LGNNDAYFLPPDEDIIKVAGKINFNHQELDRLCGEWKKQNPKQKEGKDIKSEIKTDVRNRATEMRRLENKKEDLTNIKVEDINKSDDENVDRQEDQQARSSDIHHIGGSSGGPNLDLSSGG
jgi:hypothetical protein